MTKIKTSIGELKISSTDDIIRHYLNKESFVRLKDMAKVSEFHKDLLDALRSLANEMWNL